jgi:hypothetical protein
LALTRAVFIAVISIANISVNCFAVQDCKLSTAIGAIFGYHPKSNILKYDFSFLKDHKKILILSDSDHLGGQLAPKISLAHPHQKIVSGDIMFDGGKKVSTYYETHLDNTKDFPVADNSFDAIVMRRGLCVCHGNQACGGFCSVNDESKDFFERVIKALDKNNNKSVALLHGIVSSQDIQTIWRLYFLELEAKYPIKTEFIHNRVFDHSPLFAIKITPALKAPVNH